VRGLLSPQSGLGHALFGPGMPWIAHQFASAPSDCAFVRLDQIEYLRTASVEFDIVVLLDVYFSKLVGRRAPGIRTVIAPPQVQSRFPMVDKAAARARCGNFFFFFPSCGPTIGAGMAFW